MIMSATLWDSFDHLLQEAEQSFLRQNIDQALNFWKQYYKITAKVEYQKVIAEVAELWKDSRLDQISSLEMLYNIFTRYQELLRNQKISSFTFQLYKKLIIKIYKVKFQQINASDNSLATGIFDYLSGNHESASVKLNSILKSRIDSIEARKYLGYVYMELKKQDQAIEMLTQNLFLGANELKPEDFYLSQYKMLYGRLHATYSAHDVAAWMLVFESWYRNWLIFKEDESFFTLLRNKESAERIMQVKYYQFERYRHFVRCLFIADYARLYKLKEKGLIIEQEQYMMKLDPHLFARYRNKRKELD